MHAKGNDLRRNDAAFSMICHDKVECNDKIHELNSNEIMSQFSLSFSQCAASIAYLTMDVLNPPVILLTIS